MPDPVIIVGASTRAAADSVRRAGMTPHRVHVDDAAQAPARVKAQASHLPGARVLYTAPIDRDPTVVEALAFGRGRDGLLGCSGEALSALRDPTVLAKVPQTKGLKIPATRSSVSLVSRLVRLALGSMGRTRYLRKPLPGCGGHDITWWADSQRVGRHHYLQQHIKGIPLTAVFHSDGWSSSLIGVADQLVGEPAMGVGPFEVCGHIGPSTLSEQNRAALSHLGVVLTQRHDLRGLFSVDLVMDFKGTLWPVDVDARYPQAVEVIERATGVSAINRGPTDAKRGRVAADATLHANATVHARAAAVMPDLTTVLPEGTFADAEPPGEPIAVGQCVCTVFAAGPSRDACARQLGQLARQVHAAVTEQKS